MRTSCSAPRFGARHGAFVRAAWVGITAAGALGQSGGPVEIIDMGNVPVRSTPVFAPPTGVGKSLIQLPNGRIVKRSDLVSSVLVPNDPFGGVRAVFLDVYVSDGSETSLAINPANRDNLVGCFNGSPPENNNRLMNCLVGNAAGNWTNRAFPNGGGTYTTFPFDPWVNAGLAANEFFSVFIYSDTTVGSSNTRVVLNRSANSGTGWGAAAFHAVTQTVAFQDRSMFDIDLSLARGGGAGATHDGKFYLGYDDQGNGTTGYQGSYLRILNANGTLFNELQLSAITPGGFHGYQFQPVAGANDGQVFILANDPQGGGGVGNNRYRVHEVRLPIAPAVATVVLMDKGSFTQRATGQNLGGTGRFGVNGFRTNSHMFLDVDRSNGPRRGQLFVITDFNPNPANGALDQGDVAVQVSTNGGVTWTRRLVSSVEASKTQYFSMMDVDNNGWLHVGYYQNEDGVLNAATGTVWYTVSKDGGLTWSAPERVNDAVGRRNLFTNPPANLAGNNFYLIGDYQSIQAFGPPIRPRAYVLWTQYDRTRANNAVNVKREQVICTTIDPPFCVADINGDGRVNVADLTILLGGFGLPGGPAQGDLNFDGLVNVNDLTIFLGDFGCVR